MRTSILKHSICILAFLFTYIIANAQPRITSVTPTTGKPGDVVTIVGSSFAGTVALTEVYFGNTKVTAYSSASSTTLRVIVPIGATYGPINVLDKLNKRYGTSRQFFSPIYSPKKGSFDAGDMTTSSIFSSGTNPYNVAVGDIDGDGKSDAVVVNYTDNTVSVLRNTSTVGNINFATKVDFATGANPYSVAIADIDNDAKLDIIVVNNGASTISVLKNTSTSGTVSFASKVDKATGLSGSGSTNLAVADIDFDGLQDVVVCNGGNNKVSVLVNSSTTTAISFVNKVEYATGTTPRGIAIGDIDGDTRLDIIVTNAAAGTISVIRNTTAFAGSLSLAAKVDYSVGSNPVSVALGDIDGDGKLDVITSNYNSGNISTLRNTSVSGTITLNGAVNKTTTPFAETVAIADIDADGKLDITNANDASSLAVLKNTTTATTPTYLAAVTFGTGSLTYAHALGDIDGDGKIDAVVVTNYNNGIVVVRNAPVFSSNANLSFLTTTAGAITPIFSANILNYSVSVANTISSITVTPTKQQDSAKIQIQLNGGTYTAINSGSASSALALVLGVNTINIKVTAQDGTTIKIYTLTVTKAAPPTITSISPTSGAVGTTVTITGTFFNSTPANNIVFFGATQATVTSATTTSLTVTVPTGANYAPITVLNGASTLTAASKQYFNTTFTPNKGSITNMDMTVSSNFAVNSNPYQVAVGDIDGDGKADAVVVDYDAGLVSVLKNISTTGNVNFAAKIDFTTTSRPYSVALGDINNDGKLDIVTADFLSNTISVFRNTSTGSAISFAARVDKISGLSLAAHQYCAIADFDGDGKQDVIISNKFTTDISVLRNTSTISSITFDNYKTFTTVSGPVGLAVGDIDNDGKPDVVVTGNTNFINGTVSILRNTSTSGNISFATKSDYTVGGGCSYVTLGDMNGDGYNDIVTGNSSSDDVSVLVNYSVPGTLFIDAAQNFTTGNGGSNNGIADFDGDGKLDIAVTGTAGGIYVLRNTTTATYATSFAAPVIFASATYFRGVTTGDIDGDGKADITAIGSYSPILTVLRNTPVLSSNNNLANLTVSTGTLTPVFDSLKTTYTVNVRNSVTSATITATKAQDSAKIQLQNNGNTVTSLVNLSASLTVALNVGSNIVTVKMTAQNGAVKIYTINIIRACLAPTTSTNLAICSSQLPYSWNGLTFTAAGSKTAILTTAAGCDSSTTLNISLKATSTSTTTLTSCDSLIWNGTTYKTSGSYTYHTLNSIGCDSAAKLNVTIKKSTSSWTDVNICINQLPYTWNGVSYTTSGFYTKTGFINSKGCDSVAYLNLMVNSLPNAGAINGLSSFCRSTGSITLTSSGSAGGVWSSNNSARVNVTSGGVVTATLGGNYIIYYTITNACGTDIASKNITVNVPSSSTFATSACNSYTWGGTTYTTSGIYTKTGLVNRFGCDSTSILDLTIKKTSTSSRVITICSSQLPYTWNGLTYTAAGSKTYHTTNSVGCDSAATMDLVLNEYDVPAFTISSTNGLSVCAGTGTVLTVNGINNKPGTVTFTVGGTTYTDSITASTLGNPYLYANLGASISATSATIIANDACSPLPAGSLNGRFALIRRGTCTFATKAINARNAGAIGVIIYNNVGGSAAYTPGGADTAVTFPVFGMSQTDGEALLTLLNANNNTISTNIAAPKTYFTVDNFISNSNTPFNVFADVITKDTTISITVYGASGQRANPNNAGYGLTFNCTNTQSILIKVLKTSSSTTNASVCNGDSLLFNGTYYKTAGQYIAHLTNSQGCDSSATLNLTLKTSTSSTNYINICESQLPYTVNGITFLVEGKQTTNLTNANGCDSVVTYILSTTSKGIFNNVIVNQPKCDSLFGSVSATYFPSDRRFRGTIDSTDQIQTGRLNVTGQPTSSCSLSSVNPGLLASDTKQRFYESYTLTNTTGTTACVSVNLINYNPSNSYTIAAYNGSFNPINPSQNYMAHLGNRLSLGNAYFYFSVPANTTFEIVVSNYFTGNFFGDYILEVSGLETPEFSINNGVNWQNSNNFNVVPIGNSNLIMRSKETHCETPYFNNPIAINAKVNTSSTTNLSICPSQLPYSWNGLTFAAAGSQTKTGLTNSQGCDSSATLNLTVKTNTSSTTNLSICPSQLPYSWNGLSFTVAGSQTKTGLINSQACDSSATLNLTVKTNTSSTTNLSICPSQLPYSWNGLSFTVAGSQTKTGLVNSQGCDSSATLNLTVKTNTSSTTNLSICPSQLPYSWNGITFTAAGSQTKTGLINSQGCDSSATLNLTVKTNTSSTQNLSICPSQLPYSWNGLSFTVAGSQTKTGLINSQGCDSSATLNLTVKTNTSSTTNLSICPSQLPYSWNGLTFAAAGSQTKTGLTNSQGCDSSATLNVTVKTNTSSTTNLSICPSQLPYNWNGLSFTAAGTQTKTGLINSQGCDSSATLNLTVKTNTSSTQSLSICPSALPYSWNGLSFTTAGSQTKTGLINSQGCDSSATLNLNVKTNTSSTNNLSICSSALPYSWNGLSFTTAGSQTKTGLINSQGCDSSATLNLTVKTNTSSTNNVSICPSALPYSWNGLTFTAAGSQTKTGLINSQGCDSSATLNLTVKTNTSSTNNVSICPSALPYSWNGLTFTAAGSQTKTGLINSQGCDSSATLNLTVKTNTSSTTNLSICPSQLPYSWNGLTFTAAGSQTKTGLINSQACDSSTTLNLTVKTNTSSTTNLSICPSQLPYSWNGLSFTAAGSQTKTGLINSQACDSSATLNLTVKTNTSSITDLSICPSQLPYSWNGLTFTAAGSQTKTGLTNSQGCDSSATLNLTVKTNTSSTTNLSICPSALPYSWNGLTFTVAGSQTKTGLINSQDCDSSATLNLTLKTNTLSTTNLSICPSQLPYSWNGLTFTAAGSQTKTGLVNSQGCDSSATLNLTVKTNTSSNTNLSICPSALPYSWNGLTFTVAGSQTKTGLINSQGCDSSATLNLTVKTNTSSSINYTICSGQTYLGHSTSGIFNDTLINSVGCDSVRTLNLTVTASVTPTISISTLTNNVCKGYVAVFNTTTTNQGVNPLYQWYKNGIAVGTNTNIYQDSLLNNQDSIWCVLTSSETCVTANNIKTNVVKMNVSFTITGSIKTPNGTAISKVVLYRTGSIVDTQTVSKIYNESCISSTQYGTIRPFKNNDVKKNNGVSAIDVILITNHILNKAKLNKPYKLIAADVNNNKTITNIDIIFMKRLILGLDTSFTGNRLWAFVDSSYQFPDTTNPFPYKDSISFTNLSSNKTNQTFIGVKLGDVNYDWNASIARGTSIDNVQLIIDNGQLIMDNGQLKIPIAVKNFKDLTALQYTLNFNNKDYEFVEIRNNKLAIEYNAQQANKTGNISFLWADARGEEKSLEDGSEIFTVVLKPKDVRCTMCDVRFNLTNDITEIEAWDKDNQQHNIILTKRETKNEQPETRNEWTVSPNPNDGNIVVSLSSNTKKTIVFELNNAFGKTLYKQSFEAVKGNNSFHLNLSKNTKLASGVYFIKAIGLDGENVKKIMVNPRN